MKTNKLWSILMMFVLVLGTAVSFSSCSDDDKGDSNSDGGSIIGTWRWSESDEEGYMATEVTFKSNGKGTIYIYEKYDGEVDEETGYFVWKASGNKVYLAYCKSSDDVREIDVNNSRTWDEGGIYSISGNKLKWAWFDDEGDIADYEQGDYDDEDVMIFTRKK